MACHAAERKLVGPSWADIAKKHAGKADYLAGKIRAGGQGVWGAIPMPAQNLPDADAKAIAAWLAAGAAR
jgi:cytochrome c